MADCGQFYKCVSPADFKPLSSVVALGIISGALIVADVVLSIVFGSLIPGLGLVAAAVLIAGIFELCAFLSGGKLVCIQDDQCTIGRVMAIHTVGSDKSGFEKIDDDFTFDTLPAPHSPIESLAEVSMSDPTQGMFMQPQAASQGLGLPFKGNSVSFKNGTLTEIFHVEVKGCTVHNVCIVLKASAVASAVVGAICSIPIIGWIACLIAAAIWLVLTAVIGAIAWAASHVGDPNDVLDNPEKGEITAADPLDGSGGDVILVRGDWVYDAGHDGWNEIQPIRNIHKLTDVIDAKYMGMNKADAALVDEFKKEVYDVWCEATGQASNPLVIANQGQPENNWHIHPSIDGCKPSDPPPPVIH